MARKIIIGLAGNPSSGKDTVAAYLVERYGFTHISTGDMVRFYIAEHNLGDPKRELMQKVATILRTEHGADYLVKLAIKQVSDKMIISGIRSIGEAEAIKNEGGYMLIVDAPIELRYKRAGDRGRVGDGVSFEEFKRIEVKEQINTDPNAQNINVVIEMADFTIINDKGLEHLHHALDNIVENAIAK